MKNLKIFLVLFFFSVSSLFSQEIKKETTSEVPKDTLAILPENKKKLNILLDLSSRYIWRGQSWGGNYTVVQPSVSYDFTNKISAGIWATSNFKKNYFYPDGVTQTKGYQEIDINISYKINKFLTFQLWDYYWPSVQKIDGISNNFFDYGKNGLKTVDANLLFDFSEYKLPIFATLSTFVAGNDFRYDNNGENPKRNFTTYLEVGYTLEDIYKKIQLKPVIGAVFNNQAQYYTAGDYNKVSVVNLSVKATRFFDLYKKISMPISLNFVHNGATKNTDTFGRNFLVAGISLEY